MIIDFYKMEILFTLMDRKKKNCGQTSKLHFTNKLKKETPATADNRVLEIKHPKALPFIEFNLV